MSRPSRVHRFDGRRGFRRHRPCPTGRRCPLPRRRVPSAGVHYSPRFRLFAFLDLVSIDEAALANTHPVGDRLGRERRAANRAVFHGSGQWLVVSGQWSVLREKGPAASGFTIPSPVPNRWVPPRRAGYSKKDASNSAHWPLTTDHWPLATDHYFPGRGIRSAALGVQILGSRYRRVTDSAECPSCNVGLPPAAAT